MLVLGCISLSIMLGIAMNVIIGLWETEPIKEERSVPLYITRVFCNGEWV